MRDTKFLKQEFNPPYRFLYGGTTIHHFPNAVFYYPRNNFFHMRALLVGLLPGPEPPGGFPPEGGRGWGLGWGTSTSRGFAGGFTYAFVDTYRYIFHRISNRSYTLSTKQPSATYCTSPAYTSASQWFPRLEMPFDPCKSNHPSRKHARKGHW